MTTSADLREVWKRLGDRELFRSDIRTSPLTALTNDMMRFTLGAPWVPDASAMQGCRE